jgi:hypothetical protein
VCDEHKKRWSCGELPGGQSESLAEQVAEYERLGAESGEYGPNVECGLYYSVDGDDWKWWRETGERLRSRRRRAAEKLGEEHFGLLDARRQAMAEHTEQCANGQCANGSQRQSDEDLPF